MPETHISPAMHDAVGREFSRRVSFPIAESDIRKWVLAVYYPKEPPRRFWDENAAAATSYGGIVTPEEFNPFAWMTASAEPEVADLDGIESDRIEMLLGISGPGLPVLLNGGLEVEYGTRMRPGDVITAVGRISTYTERTGRPGLMLFTVAEETWTNQHAEVVKRAWTTTIRY